MTLQIININDERILNYQLTDAQLEFTMHPVEASKLAKNDSERHLIGYDVDGELTTFFVLHEEEGVKDYSNNPNAILLRSFSTDVRHLGKGYAKKALLELPHFIAWHFAHIDEVVLAVNLHNEIAQKLYFTVGFVDEGRRMQGRKGVLKVLTRQLKEKVDASASTFNK